MNDEAAIKKVIFIGGTSYSGSTFLDMVLANSPDGFSCGEVSAFFHPYRPHHLDPVCGCGDPTCTLWDIVRKRGPENLYQTIFDLHPEVRTIVDSSKSPLWIEERIRDLKKAGIAVENVLIWKRPQEYFESCSKRGREKGWQRAWVNYHRHYFSRIDDWVSLPYRQLANSPEVLKQLCSRIGIPYFEGKAEYWHKKHHTLFGNTSAKIHLYDKDSQSFIRCKNELESTIQGGKDEKSFHHKAVYYRSLEQDKEATELWGITTEIEQVLHAVYQSGTGRPNDEVRAKLKKLQAKTVYRLAHCLKTWGREKGFRFFSKLSGRQ